MSSGQEPAAQITNTLFPPPPEFYKQFTDENVARYEALKDKEAGLERLRGSLQPPRADWIEEEGRWVTFGEMHAVR
jgi:mediator of RNA polymerase II transcription subunit 7